MRTVWAIIRKLNDGITSGLWLVVSASPLCYTLSSFKEIDMKYVRYIADGSEFMRKGDIGVVVNDDHDGVAFDVRWLNPIVPHTETLPTWFVMACHVEEIE